MDYKSYSLYPITNDQCEHLIITMNSSADTVANYIRKQNDNSIGLLQINMFRPLEQKLLINKLQQLKNLKYITVLDRSRELLQDDVLFTEISSLLNQNGIKVKTFSGCYGISGKEFTEQHVESVKQNALNEQKPKFTLGINDDVEFNSLKPAKVTNNTVKSMH